MPEGLTTRELEEQLREVDPRIRAGQVKRIVWVLAQHQDLCSDFDGLVLELRRRWQRMSDATGMIVRDADGKEVYRS